MSKTVRALFNGTLREIEVENHPYIETYIKVSSILNRLDNNKYSNYCPKGLKSSEENLYFYV